jgi:hypothetical protein
MYIIAYNVYNAYNSKVPVREGSQNANIGGCLGWRSLAKQLVPSQKNIRYTNQPSDGSTTGAPR